jgi:hypothetical protein
MPDRVYRTSDGLQVILEEETWLHHIQDKHMEVTEAEIGEALQHPARICAHTSYPDRRIYEGRPRASGFFHGSFVVVVVAITGTMIGHVITAHLATLRYRGQQLWPPPTDQLR